MATLINIPEADREVWRKYYTERRNEIDAILSQLDGTKVLVQAKAPQKETQVNISSSDYSPAWNWLKKINYFIKQNGGEATTAQIADALFAIEPDLAAKRKKVVASMSSILSSNSKEDGIYGKRPDDRGTSIYSIK